MAKPEFKDGTLILEDYAGRKLCLPEQTWKHIVEEKGRDYFERFYDKFVETLKNPSQVRQSTKEKNVVIYEKLFDDFYIANTVLSRAYLSVVVNWSTNRIRTAYPSIRKRQKGKLLWPTTK